MYMHTHVRMYNLKLRVDAYVFMNAFLHFIYGVYMDTFKPS